MPRKLTATTGILLALVLAGCGKDEPADTAPQSVAATTTPAATAPSTPKSKSTTSASSGSDATTKSSTSSSAKESSGTSSTGSKTASTAKKATTTAQKAVGVTPASGADSGSGSGSGDDPSSGTGSGPVQERLEVVATLRRYYKAFVDKDGDTVCSLLTSAGRAIMVADGRAKTCAASAERLVAQAGEQNLMLLETTRDGLHADDITVTGNNAVAQIGETSRLRLVQEDGRWLVRSPNVTTGSE